MCSSHRLLMVRWTRFWTILSLTQFQVSVSPDCFTDLNYADDVTGLAKLPDLVQALTCFANEAAKLGLQINWR